MLLTDENITCRDSSAESGVTVVTRLIGKEDDFQLHSSSNDRNSAVSSL